MTDTWRTLKAWPELILEQLADAGAMVDALLALGRIAEDLGDVVQSIDINPFVVLPHGGFALDALFVSRAHDSKQS